jgi:hypothetical protein
VAAQFGDNFPGGHGVVFDGQDAGHRAGLIRCSQRCAAFCQETIEGLLNKSSWTAKIAAFGGNCRECVTNVEAAEGCDLLNSSINAENPPSLVVYCILHGSGKFKIYNLLKFKELIRGRDWHGHCNCSFEEVVTPSFCLERYNDE